MSTDWTTFKIWRNVSPIEFEDHLWQDKNSITRPLQLKQALDGMVSQEFLEEIETGLSQVGMAIRLNPYVMSLID
ncbi:MAG: hypothetical protein ABSD88_06675, partial [Candidatus Korobacteraceae bacterium]